MASDRGGDVDQSMCEVGGPAVEIRRNVRAFPGGVVLADDLESFTHRIRMSICVERFENNVRTSGAMPAISPESFRPGRQITPRRADSSWRINAWNITPAARFERYRPGASSVLSKPETIERCRRRTARALPTVKANWSQLPKGRKIAK